MSISIIAGFISIVKPADARFCISIIQEENSDKFLLVFSDYFMEINGEVVDISNYDVLDTFDDIETAITALPAAMIAMDWHIRECIEKHGGTVGKTKITFDNKEYTI